MPRRAAAAYPPPGVSAKKLRPRKAPPPDPTVSKVFQDTVFGIPELAALITTHLSKGDLRNLIRTCRAWHEFWAPYLYSKLRFRRYKRTRAYPKMMTYGQFVKSLDLSSCKWNNILHLLDYSPNLTSLSIHDSSLSLEETEEILGMVPRLRVLSLSPYSSARTGPEEDPFHLVAKLKDLEEFTWKGSSTCHVFVDDVLNILHSCKRLRSLTLATINLINELPASVLTMDGVAVVAPGPEDKNQTLAHIQDKDWRNTALKSLDYHSVTFGKRSSESAAHPCIRRLFERIPNLTVFKFTGISNMRASDWDFVFANRANIQTLELWRYNYGSPGDTPATKAALEAVAKSCPNLRVVDFRNLTVTSDKLIEDIILQNTQIQKLSANNTELGDLSLKALARVPSSLSPSLEWPLLTVLELEGCHRLTAGGVSKIMETCGRLQMLNLADTMAGTIHLFKGTQTWACAKSLQRLKIDIQPLNFQPQALGTAYLAAGETEHLYTTEECLIIQGRLSSLTSLLGLEMRGQAMDFAMVDDLTFAPNLQRVLLYVPFRDTAPAGTIGNLYQRARGQANEWIKDRFPGWKVWASGSYARRGLVCSVNASRDTAQFFF